jgi:hypothetical protein
MNVSEGICLLPTRGRVSTNVPRFLAAAKATHMTVPGALVVDGDDYQANRQAYDALDLPDNWSIYLARGGSLVAASNEAVAELLTRDMQFLMIMSDDNLPVTDRWDALIVESLQPWQFVSSDDGAQAPKRANGVMVWGADLIRAVGYLYPPSLHHMWAETIWEELGRATNCWSVNMGVLVRHLNATYSQPDDTGAHVNRHLAADERAFHAWRENEMAPTVEHVLGCMEAHGVRMFRPDLKGYKVMIATPCGSGEYGHGYVSSLFQTMEFIRQYGGEPHRAELIGCSDIALARNRLFGGFLRSDCTHLLWADSDQDWNAMDVVRLLMSGEDFVAVASVKKTFPTAFAVSVDSKRGPVHVDPETGFIEVDAVGGAFVVITRACAERMAAAYADLTYVEPDGTENVGVFMPMIENRKYLGEDFSMCARWRAIGGCILVASDVNLGHTGNFRYDGSWLAHLTSHQERVA